MRILASIAILLASAANSPAPEGTLHPVTGTWSVDLRLSLDDSPYSQPMVLEVAEDNAVAGSFYGADIETGRLGEAQGRTCVFFRTSDGSGPYQTTACLVDGKMIGQTWSEGRNFVLPWTAERL